MRITGEMGLARSTGGFCSSSWSRTAMPCVETGLCLLCFRWHRHRRRLNRQLQHCQPVPPTIPRREGLQLRNTAATSLMEAGSRLPTLHPSRCDLQLKYGGSRLEPRVSTGMVAGMVAGSMVPGGHTRHTQTIMVPGMMAGGSAIAARLAGLVMERMRTGIGVVVTLSTEYFRRAR